MATQVEKLDIEIGARGASGVETSLQRIAERLEHIGTAGQNAARGTKQADDKLQGMLKSAKRAFGEESTFGGTMKMLAGGGAIMGLTLGLDRVEAMAKALGDMQARVASGQASWAGLTDEILRSIPVFGQAYSATSELLKVASGEAIVDAAKKEAARVDQMIQHSRRLADPAANQARVDAWLKPRSDLENELSAARNKIGKSYELAGDFQNNPQVRAAMKRELDAAESVIRKKYTDKALAELERDQNMIRDAANSMFKEAENLRVKSNQLLLEGSGNVLAARMLGIRAGLANDVAGVDARLKALGTNVGPFQRNLAVSEGENLIRQLQRSAGVNAYAESMRAFGDLQKMLSGAFQFQQREPGDPLKAIVAGAKEAGTLRELQPTSGPRLSGLYESRFEVGQTTGGSFEKQTLGAVREGNKLIKNAIEVLERLHRDRVVLHVV